MAVDRGFAADFCLAQDFRNRTVLTKAKAHGRPGLEPDRAFTLVAWVEGPSLGGAPEAVLDALVEQTQSVLCKTLRRMVLQQTL